MKIIILLIEFSFLPFIPHVVFWDIVIIIGICLEVRIIIWVIFLVQGYNQWSIVTDVASLNQWKLIVLYLSIVRSGLRDFHSVSPLPPTPLDYTLFTRVSLTKQAFIFFFQYFPPSPPPSLFLCTHFPFFYTLTHPLYVLVFNRTVFDLTPLCLLYKLTFMFICGIREKCWRTSFSVVGIQN